MRKIYLSLLSFLFVFTTSAQQTILIDPLGDGGFENGTTFPANGWTLVAGTATNKWWVGNAATPSAGTKCAYISDNVSGTTYNYNTGSASVVYFYRDVTFPAGETEIVLNYKWKAQGETNNDWICVWSGPTTTTLTANSPSPASQSWTSLPTIYPGAVIHSAPAGLLLQGTNYQTQTLCLPASYAGTTRRLVFMWSNNATGGSQPPGSVDEISLTSALPPAAPASQPTGLVLTPVSTSQIDLTFTPTLPASTGYLVVRYPAGATPVAPTNGSFYSIGSSLGSGTVMGFGSNNNITNTLLNSGTAYDFYVYSFNASSCFPPVFNVTTPLFGSVSTPTCAPLAGGTYSVGPTGTYPTLGAALAAAGNGTTGNVIFELQSTYSSASETFPLTFAGHPCPITGNVTVRPAAGATGLVITSSNASATLDFNGGDQFIIDGRPGGTGTTSQLSIVNTSITGVAVRFINDAQNNTLTYLDLQGQNTTAPATAVVFNAGVVYIGPAQVATGYVSLGNDKITISNCNIHGTPGNTPAHAIYGIGTTTTNASYNDSITIINNKIYDFFSPAAVSAGVRAEVGTNAWTISGNSFYETVPRTTTNPNTHRAIWCTPTTGTLSATASGFVINDNYIGGSTPLAGGAPLTMTGAFGNQLTAIELSVGYGTPTSVQNNIIRNMDLSTTNGSGFMGIVQTNGHVNIGTVTGNTIGSSTATGDILVTTTASGGSVVIGCRAVGGNSAVVNIANNKIGGITTVGNATIGLSIQCIQAAGAGTVNIINNLIGSNTVANSINASSSTTGSNQAVTGINVTSGTTTTIIGNTVANLNNNYISNSTAGQVRGIAVAATATTISNNVVHDLSCAAPQPGSLSNAAVIGIMAASTSLPAPVVTGNNVYALVSTNTTTASVKMTGIYYSGSSVAEGLVAKNNIHSFDMITTNPTAFMTGLDYASGPATISNNMIRLGIKADGTPLTNEVIIRGISSNSTAAVNNFYHNSIYIGGTVSGTSTTVNSLCFGRTSSGSAHDIRDNIFTNVRSNTTSAGKNYAVSFTTNMTGVNMDNNVYQYSGNGVLFGNNGVADVNSYTSGWIGSDVHSLTGNPLFANPTANASAVDLHLTTGSVAEGTGALISTVTDDFDGQARSGLTPTDIGADAGNYGVTGIDVGALTLVSPLAGGCGSASQQVIVRIKNYSANTINFVTSPVTVSASGTGPVTYNSNIIVNTGTLAAGATLDITLPAVINTSAPGTYVFNSNTSVTGDANVTNDAIAATNVVVTAGSSLGGTYTVGAGGNYATLTAAVAAYNTVNCISGNIVFSLTDPLYNTASGESFPIRIQHINNPGNYTLTIRPASGVSAMITTATDSALIKLNGADNIIIDGSNNGTNSRNLTFKNDKAASQAAGIWVASLGGPGNGAVNNTIKNIIVIGGTSTLSAASGVYGIVSASNSSMSLGNADNDNLTVTNNAISKVTVGISALSSIITEEGLVISNNQIGSNNASEYVNATGIGIAYANNALISGNTIFNLINLPTNTNPVAGIEVGTGCNSGSVIGNYINKLSNPSPTGGLRCTGINFPSAGVSNILIANNMIGDIKTINYLNPNINNAIGMNFSAGNNLKVYNNTIALSGTVSSGTGPGFSTNIYIAGPTVNNMDFRNNLLYNTMDFAFNNASAYNIYMSAATAFGTCNYNNYYGTSSATTTYRIGFDGLAQRPTLNDWKIATGQDQNSLAMQPIFASATDYHIDIALSTLFDNKGTPVPGVTDDIDGDTRSTTTPDIGADEFAVVTGIDFGTKTLASPADKLCYSNAETVAVRIRNYSTNTHNFAAIPVTVRVSATGTNPQTFAPVVVNTGSLASGDSLLVVVSNNYNMSVPGTYTFSSYTTVSADVQALNDTMDVTTRTLAPITAGTVGTPLSTYCVSGTPTLTLMGNNGSAIQWQSSSTAAGPWTNVGTNSNSYTPASALSATTYYRTYVVCNATSDTSNTQIVTINNPQILSTAPATRCGPGSTTLGVTGSANTTFNWYSVPTGGVAIANGPAFTTPIINNSTTYYVAASLGGSTSNVGLSTSAVNCGASTVSSSVNWPLRFNTTAPVTINSVWIVPAAAGTFTIGIGQALVNSYFQTWSVNITAAQVGIPMQVILGYQITTPGSYQLVNVANGSMRIPSFTCNYPFVSAGGGFQIVGSASFATSLTSTTSYNTFFDINVSEGCESPRQAITATVTTAPAFDVTNDLAVCNNATTTLQVNSNVSDFNTYVWTPATNLFINAAATTAYTTGANASVLYEKSATPGTYTYIVQANNSTTGCQNFDSVKVTVLPVVITVVPSPDQICMSGVSTLGIIPDPSTFGTAQYQWQTSPNNTGYTNIPSANASSYTTPTLSTTTFYKVDLKNSLGVSCTTAYDTVIVNNPAILSTTPASICGSGTLTLNATATPGATINWYTAPVGGTLLGTGTTFTTPNLTQPTTYYAAALNGTGGKDVGVKTSEFAICGFPVANGSTDYPIRFTTNRVVILNSAWVVPSSASLTVALRLQGSNADLMTQTFNFLPSQIGNINSPVQINFGWIISTPGNYQLTNTSGGLYRITTLGCGYPFSSPTGGFTITGSSTSSTAADATSYYNGFYQLNISEGCESPRLPVVAQVNTFTAISQQPTNISSCVGGTVNLVVGAAGNNLVYQWRKNGSNIANSNNDTLTINPITLADAGTYDVVITGTCGTVTSAVVTVNVSASNVWNGIVSSDWNDPANWCGGVPTSTSDIVISSGAPFQPVINASLAYVRNLTINSGATVTVQPNGTLNLYGDFVNNGNLVAAGGYVFFKGTSNQNIGSMNVGNIMVNGASGITLTAGMVVNTSAVLINGNVTLGVNNLAVTGDVTGTLASHVVTNSSGSLISKNVGTTMVTVPVGPSAASYNPVTIVNGSGRDYAVRVATGLNPTIANPGFAVNRTWNITPNGAGTPTNVNLTFRYEDTHMNNPGVATNTMEIGLHNGTSWSAAVPSVTPGGTPTQRTVGGSFGQFGSIVVSNIGGISWITATNPPVDPTVSSVQLLPNLVETSATLRVISTRAAKIRWNVIDGQGRTVMSFDGSVLQGQNDIQLQLSQLAAGMYHLSGTTDKGLTTVVKFVKQ